MRRLGLVLVLLGALALPASAQFSILGIKNSLFQFALDQISVPGELEVTAEGVEDGEDGATEILGLAVADAEGTWLRVERVSLRWNATRILGGEIEITRLALSGVDVLRAPAPAAVAVEVKEGSALAETDDEPFDWPRSPITLRVSDLRAERVSIAGGVIAEKALAFDAAGALRDEGDVQSMGLTITRTDTVAGRIAVDFLRDFAADTLTLTLDADEAPGGVVAALAGFPATSASRLALEGAGPMTDWALSFDASAEDVFDAGGAADIDIDGRVAVNADFTLTPGPALDPALARALAPAARLRIDVAEDDAGVIAIRRGALEAAALSLTATGAYDRPRAAADLKIALDIGGALSELVEGVAFDRAGFEGAAVGPLDDLRVTGALSLSELRTAAADVGAAALDADIRLTAGDVAGRVSGRAARLRLDRIGPDLIGDATLAIEGGFANDVARLARFSLSAAPLTLDASGEADLAASRASLTYRLEAPDLAPLAGAYDVDAAGALSAAGDLDGPLDAPRLNGTVALADLTFNGEAYGEATLDHDATFGPAPEGRAAFRAAGSRFGPLDAAGRFRLADERLSLSGLSARALSAEIAGDAVVDLATTLVSGAVTLDAPDLAPIGAALGRTLEGAAAGDLRLAVGAGAKGATQDVEASLTLSSIRDPAGRLSAATLTGLVRDARGTPQLDIALDFENAAGAGAAVERGRLAIRGPLDGFEIDGRVNGVAGYDARVGALTLAGRIDDIEADERTADLTLGFDAAAYAPAGLTVRRGAATVAGGLKTLTFDAALDGVAADAGAARAVTASGRAEDLAGADPRFDIAAALDGARAGPAAIARGEATAKGALSDFRAALRLGPIEAEGARLGGVALDARAVDIAGADPRLKADLSASGIFAGPFEGGEATLNAAGPLSALAMALDATGAMAGGPVKGPARLSARARIDAPGGAATISAFEATAGEDGATTLRLDAPLSVRSAGGATRIEGLALSALGAALTGDAALFPSGAAADLALTAPDLGPIAALAGAPIDRGAATLAARIDTRPGRAGGAATATVTGLRFADVVADIGALDLAADADWNGRRAALSATLSGPFDQPLEARAAIPLRAGGGLAPAIPAGAALEGAVNWAGEIGDLWALVPAPGHVLAGATRVALILGGTIAAPTLGGDVSLSEGRYENLDVGAILVDLEARSEVSPNGAFVVDLSANDGAGGPVTGRVAVAEGAIDATVSTTGATLIRRDDVTAAISLDIAARGPLSGPDITGEVLIDRAEVRLVAATPPGVADLGEVRIKGEDPPAPTEPAGGDVALDIAIRAPDDVFVRGRGLDSEWSIDLKVSGTAADPRVKGLIAKRRGVLSLLGRDFDLDRGEIRFTGAKGIDPTLDIRLLRDNDGVRGGVAVTGVAKAPEIAFTSRPALPEEEVLPRVLFGRSKQSLSPSEALSLALGVATLLDGGGGAVDSARGAIGVDVLRIDGGGETGPSVTVGSNVADGVFVGAKQPIAGGSASVEVEVEVFDEITIDSEFGPDVGTSIGLNWKRDF